MNVYVAIKRGVYRHDVLGAWEYLDSAIETGKAFVDAEEDHYHQVEVVRVIIGLPGERLVGSVVAKWDRQPNPEWGRMPPGVYSQCSMISTYVGTEWVPHVGD